MDNDATQAANTIVSLQHPHTPLSIQCTPSPLNSSGSLPPASFHTGNNSNDDDDSVLMSPTSFLTNLAKLLSLPSLLSATTPISPSPLQKTVRFQERQLVRTFTLSRGQYHLADTSSDVIFTPPKGQPKSNRSQKKSGHVLRSQVSKPLKLPSVASASNSVNSVNSMDYAAHMENLQSEADAKLDEAEQRIQNAKGHPVCK